MSSMLMLMAGAAAGLLIGLPAAPLTAQAAPEPPVLPDQVVYLEVGGPTGVASLNYDRLFRERWALRLGLEVDGSGPHISEWFPQIPVTLSYISFASEHGTEVGGGAVVTLGSPYPGWRIFELVLHTAYRYQPIPSGLFFRAELLTMPGRNWFTWAGLGLGYAF